MPANYHSEAQYFEGDYAYTEGVEQCGFEFGPDREFYGDVTPTLPADGDVRARRGNPQQADVIFYAAVGMGLNPTDVIWTIFAETLVEPNILSTDVIGAWETVFTTLSESTDYQGNAATLVLNVNAQLFALLGTPAWVASFGKWYTLTFEAKAAGWDFIQLWDGAGFANFNVNMSLIDGSIAGSYTGTASSESLGDGWYRFKISVQATVDGTAKLYLQMINSMASARFSSIAGADGQSGFILANPLLQQAQVPGAYKPKPGDILTVWRGDPLAEQERWIIRNAKTSIYGDQWVCLCSESPANEDTVR